MARYQIDLSKEAAKNYTKLPEQYKVLVDMALKKLSEGQHLDIKPLKGEKDTYGIRVGRYKILYLKIARTLLITRIADRKDAYK